jgi:hypothetical protein
MPSQQQSSWFLSDKLCFYAFLRRLSIKKTSAIVTMIATDGSGTDTAYGCKTALVVKPGAKLKASHEPSTSSRSEAPIGDENQVPG